GSPAPPPPARWGSWTRRHGTPRAARGQGAPGYARAVPLFDTIADLAVSIDGYEIERASLDVSTGFTRITTTVVMKGKGLQGRGEAVRYTGPAHAGFPEPLPAAGDHTLLSASAALDGHDLFAAAPAMEASRDYRRWAFESAILDLALQQHGT